MFKQNKLKLRYTSTDHMNAIINNLQKSSSVSNIQVEEGYVSYEQYGWSNNQTESDND